MYDNELLCPRLIDYIAIVGLKNHSKYSRGRVQTPELLRRYPPFDHKNGALPPDVVYFCQPDGCQDSSSSRINGRENHNYFVFTLTEKETSIIRYGICVNFMRPIERKSPTRSPKRVPPDLPNESNKIPRQMGSTSSTDMPSKESKSVVEERKKRRNKPRTHSLTSLLIVTHHAFFRGFYKCLIVLKEIIESRDHRIKKKSNRKDSIWPTLLGYGSESTNSMIHHDVVEIETWIFRLLSAPVPVPGITKLELSLLPDSAMESLIFALPDNERLPLADFPLHSIFELVGVEFGLKLFFSVLLENKVIIQSRNYGSLYLTIQAIKVLFYPLEYLFTVAILLPSSMPDAENLFNVPSPFIIGVPTSFLESRPKFYLSNEIMLFDIDEKKLLRRDNQSGLSESNIDELIYLPPNSDFEILVKHIKQNVKRLQALISISDSSQPIKNFDDISPTKISETLLPGQLLQQTQKSKYEPLPSKEITEFNPLIFGNDSDSVDISTRVAMIRFLNSPNILSNFSRYIRVLKLYPKPIVAFQTKNFIESRKTKSSFIKKLAKTQAVLSFAEWNIAPSNTVFSKILTRKLDPRVIGDKVKWYHQSLETVPFRVYRDNGSCTLHLHLKSPQSSGNWGSHDDGIFDSDSSSPTYDDGDGDDDCLCDDSDERRFSTSSHSSNMGLGSISSGANNVGQNKEKNSTNLLGSDPTNTDSGCSTMFDQQTCKMTVDISKVYHPPNYLQIPNIGILDRNKYATQISCSVGGGAPSSVTSSNSTMIMTHASEQQGLQQHHSTPPSSVIQPHISLLEQQTYMGSTPSSATGPGFKCFSDTEEIYTKQYEISRRKKNEILENHHHDRLEAGDVTEENSSVSQAPKKDVNLKNTRRSLTPDSNPGIFSETRNRFFRFIDNVTGSASNISSKPSGKASLITDRNKLLNRAQNGRLSVVRNEELQNQIKQDHSQTNSRRSSLASIMFPKKSEQNEHNLNQIIENVKRGTKPGLLNQFKLQSLMDNESNRNFVLSKINLNICNMNPNDDEEYNHGNEFIQDVPIETEEQFEALVFMCRQIINGIQTSYEKGDRSEGFSSAFVLLEMLNTHYINIKEPFNQLSIPTSAAHTPAASEYNIGDNASTVNIINNISSVRIGNEDYEKIEIYPDSIQSPFHTANSVSSVTNNTVAKRPNQLNLKKTNSNSDFPCSYKVEPSGLKVYNDYTLNCKSSETQGYRFRLNRLVTTHAPELPTEIHQIYPDSPTRSIPKSAPPPRTSTISVNKNPNSPTATLARWLKPNSPVTAATQSVVNNNHNIDNGANPRTRLYLYEKFVEKGRRNNQIWDNMSFWEDVFLDAVCSEREVIGLDLNAKELLDRYNGLDDKEKKQLESGEDELLSILLNNLIGFMIMMRVDPKIVKKQVNCTVGKSHIGLDQSENFRRLTDSLLYLKGNAVDLRNNLSRRQAAKSFQVIWNPPQPGGLQLPLTKSSITTTQNVALAEVHTDCVVLRSITGRIIHRWWFERIFQCHLKKNTLTIVSREAQEICSHSFFCKKKAKELAELIINSSKTFKENTETLSNIYHVTDEVTKMSGNLEITDDGITLKTEKSEFQWFVQLIHIRKCCTRKPDKFIIEIIDPNTKNATYRIFKSNNAGAILKCYKQIQNQNPTQRSISPISSISTNSSICSNNIRQQSRAAVQLKSDDEWEYFSLTNGDNQSNSSLFSDLSVITDDDIRN